MQLGKRHTETTLKHRIKNNDKLDIKEGLKMLGTPSKTEFCGNVSDVPICDVILTHLLPLRGSCHQMVQFPFHIVQMTH